MSETTIGQDERDEREFVRFLHRARRRVWLLCVAFYFAPGAALGGALSLLLLHYYPDGPRWNAYTCIGFIGGAASICGLLALTFPFSKRRHLWQEYLAHADQAFDSAGRIQAAADFASGSQPLSAFQRLALADAAWWIKHHPRAALPWSLRPKRQTIRATLPLALLCVLIIAGCESPQQVQSPRKYAEPEPPIVIPQERTARTEFSSTDEPGAPTPPPETQAAAAAPVGVEQPAAAPGDDSSDQGGDCAGAVAGEGAGANGSEAGADDGDEIKQSHGTGTIPSPVAQTEQPDRNEAQHPTPSSGATGAQPDEQSDSQSPIGPGAGTETGLKVEETGIVEAPEENIAAKATDDQTQGATGDEVEGEGVDFTEGSQPAPASQPADVTDFRQSRREDLLRERVSPARRALIERYFQRLNRAASRPSSPPASQPAATPASKDNEKSTPQPAKKD